MLHKILITTDRFFIGQVINIDDRPITLIKGNQTVFFVPDRVVSIGNDIIRLSNSNYTIDAEKQNA